MVVVHHQNPGAAQIGGRQQGAGRSTALERHGHPKRRALAKLAVHAHFAVHQLGQALANRQPQACAAIAARGGSVRLLKALEQTALLLVGHTDTGVAHLKTQRHLVAGGLHQPHRNADFTHLGEFDRVVGVIDENLPQPQGIADHVGRHIGRHITHQFQALGASLVAHHVRDTFEHAIEQKRLPLHHQLAGLDFGKIQDVVDHAQQVLPCLLDLADVVMLARAEARLERQVRHPDDGVHGRADLVAHVGQEVGFERCGFFRKLLGAAQFLLGQLPVGNVHKRTDGAARRAISAGKTMQPEQRVVELPICIGQVHLPVDRAPLAHGLDGVAFELCLRRRGQVVQIHHCFADQCLARDTESVFIGTIDPDISTIGILVEKRHRYGIDQGLLKIQLACHLLFEQLLLVDVHVDTHHTQGFSVDIAEDARGLQKPAHLAIGAHDAP